MKNYHLDWTDLLYFPAAYALSYVFNLWLPSYLAIALAVMMLLFVFSILGSRSGKIKSLILPLLVAGLVTFVLAMLFRSLP